MKVPQNKRLLKRLAMAFKRERKLLKIVKINMFSMTWEVFFVLKIPKTFCFLYTALIVSAPRILYSQIEYFIGFCLVYTEYFCGHNYTKKYSSVYNI